MSETKICSICKTEKPISEFYARMLYRRKVQKKVKWHDTRCRICASAQTVALYYKNNQKDKVKERRKTFAEFCSMTLSNASTRSKKFKFDFDLPKGFIKVLWDKQNGKCALSGKELDWIPQPKGSADTRANDFRASLDRINSKKGYTIDNVRLICWYVNDFKKDRSDATLKERVLELATAFKNKELSIPVSEGP